MVESKESIVKDSSKADLKWAVLIACSYGNPPVPEVLTNLEYMEKLIGLLGFDHVSVFREEQATRETVD